MKKHTKIYLSFFGHGIDSFIPCEICGARAVDIHHIDARGMGGTEKDDINNLMAVCRTCHIEYGDKKQYLDFLKEKHMALIDLIEDPKKKKKGKQDAEQVKKQPPGEISHEMVDHWSDWVGGNLKQGETFDQLFDRFDKANPNHGIDKQTLFNELEGLRMKAHEQAVRNGAAKPGDYTTIGYQYPKLTYDGKDLGRMNGKGQTRTATPDTSAPVKLPAHMLRSKLPDDVKDEDIYFDTTYNRVAWKDPDTTDTVYGDDKTMLYEDPRIKKIVEARKKPKQ